MWKNKIQLLIALSIFLSFAGYGQWKQTGPLPSGSGIVNAFAVKGNTLFANSGNYFTSGSGVISSVNNGETWLARNSGLNNISVNTLLVYGSSIFAGTSDGIYVSSDDGGNWAAFSANTLSCKKIWHMAAEGNTVYALASTVSGIQGQSCSSLYRSTGGTFAQVSNLYTSAFAISGSTIFATSGFSLFTSVDGGASWIFKSTTPTAAGCLAASGNSLYAGCYFGVYLSTDGGIQWTPVRTGMTYWHPYQNQTYYAAVRTMVISSPRIFASSWGLQNMPNSSPVAGFYLSTNDGESWVEDNNGFPTGESARPGISSLFIYEQDLYAGTVEGGIWKRQLSNLTGLREISGNKLQVSAYPNPVSEILTLVFDLQYQGNNCDIKIFNTVGQQISTYNPEVINQKFSVDVSDLSPGIYLLQAYKNNQLQATGKFIKK